MIVESHTSPKPGRTKNDDIAGYESGTFWLMDGATQLVQPAHGKDASWHVGRLDAAFRAAIRNTPDIDLATLARAAIKSVADEFFEATGLNSQSPQELRPFSTLVLCRPDAKAASLDYLVVCDSTLAVIGGGDETVISDERIGPLGVTNDILKQGHGFDSDSYRKALCDLYDATHKRINVSGGFDVVGQDDGVIERALRGRIPLKPNQDVLLMSDGFTRAIDTLGLYKTWRDLHAGLKEKGGEEIIREIRATESADNQGRKYPRATVHDDATLLWLRNDRAI